MRIPVAIRAVPLAALALAAASPSVAQPGRIQIGADWSLERDAAHADTTIYAAFRVELEPGYHVNSNVPLDDSLIPTVLTLTPPPGIETVGLAYPDAVMLEQIGVDEPLAVFEEQFVIGVSLSLAGDLPLGEYRIPGTFRYQACDEQMCYMPTSLETELVFPVVAASQALAKVNPDIFEGLSFDKQVAMVEPLQVAEPADTQIGKGDGDVLALLDGFTVLGSTGGYLGSDDFLEFVGAAETGEVQRGLFEGRGPLAILALILIGGLALNLTPCVLPMIPINLAIIGAGVKAGSRVRGFALGAAYGSAMALVYGVLGLVVILTAGTFGTINSSPWFNLGIAALFIVLALAMFDVIVIDFSRFQNKFDVGGRSKGSFLVAFGMGAVAALLAGACVAPVVIQVILFSSNLYATGTAVALLLPFFLGLGMALPWPIAGAGLSFLPKPGAWMVRVKQAFGVFILATATYYGYLSYELFSSRWVDAAAVASSVEEKIGEGWYASMSAGLAAARAENKLVLVDVWATWCKNCLTMDRTTFEDPNVLGRLDDYVKIKFRAEDPSISPAREVMQRFDGVGLPTYAILRPTAGES